MPDTVRLTTRDRALALAVSIIDARAEEVERVYQDWSKKYPDDTLGAATERSAYMECKLLARLVMDRMSERGRVALRETQDG